MTSVLAGWLVGLSDSRVAIVLAGMTVTMALALLAVRFARRSRASVRHLLLVSAFAVLAILPVASVVAPAIHIAVPIATVADAASVVASGSTLETTTSDLASIAGERRRADSAIRRVAPLAWTTVALAVWAIGVVCCLVPIGVGLSQMRSLRRKAMAWKDAGSDVLVHSDLRSPVTFGVLRPVVVMPVDAVAWPYADLMRALVHEREHVRRRDWLSQCASRVVCALYWFHPLVWAARRRLDLEAERACDDAVLRYEARRGDGTDPTAYADQLVVLAQRLSSSSRQPLLAMANRADLAARVNALLDARQRRGRAGASAVIGAAAAAALAVATMSTFKVVAAPQTISNAQAPAFEVASIKPCDPQEPVLPAGSGSRQGGGGSPIQTSPNRLTVICGTVDRLIASAYVINGEALLNNQPSGVAEKQSQWIRNLPDWATKQTFTIEATSPQAVDRAVMLGPMLRALLEDRFKLTLHRGDEEVPMYSLVVAKGGLKMKPIGPDGCTKNDGSVGFASHEAAMENARAVATGEIPPRCNSMTMFTGGEPNSRRWVIGGETIEKFAQTLSSRMDRHVVDKTGVKDMFNIRLEFADDDQTSPAPPLAKALEEQLGLKLESTKDRRTFLVIDRLVRPISSASLGR